MGNSESRKTEQVTMKSNVESEFVIKKLNFSFDIRVSMILAFFEKIVLFLSTPVLTTLVTGHIGLGIHN